MRLARHRTLLSIWLTYYTYAGSPRTSQPLLQSPERPKPSNAKLHRTACLRAQIQPLQPADPTDNDSIEGRFTQHRTIIEWDRDGVNWMQLTHTSHWWAASWLRHRRLNPGDFIDMAFLHWQRWCASVLILRITYNASHLHDLLSLRNPSSGATEQEAETLHELLLNIQRTASYSSHYWTATSQKQTAFCPLALGPCFVELTLRPKTLSAGIIYPAKISILNNSVIVSAKLPVRSEELHAKLNNRYKFRPTLDSTNFWTTDVYLKPDCNPCLRID